MDPSLPVIDYSDFTTKPQDFAEYYRDAREELPHDMPIPRGHNISMTAFVDASFAQKKRQKNYTQVLLSLLTGHLLNGLVSGSLQ